jgi:sensor histidine kinase YesM
MDANCKTRNSLRFVAWFVGFCVVVNICAASVIVSSTGWHGWHQFWRTFAFSFVFTSVIGGTAWLVTPPVAYRIWPWNPLLRWTVLVAVLTACSLAGTAVGTGILGLFGIGQFVPLYWEMLRSAIPITLIVGVITVLIEASKANLQAVQVALREQQVERAHAETLAAEAQLASLSSRIQPHFLFNTLNSIAALIREDPKRAETMVEQLSSLLRGSLDSAKTVPIDRELKLVVDYLEIQMARLGDRLRYTTDWSIPGLEGASVPPFALQTLVENSLKHVAGERQEGVTLSVRVHRSGQSLVLEVTDNGPGFGPELIKSGHGLDNLQARLRALYGDRAKLEFGRAPAAMTVRLRIPVKE